MSGSSANLLLLLAIYLTSYAAAPLPSLDDFRSWNGTYTIVNKASGRRISSSKHGFAAISQGPIQLEQQWRVVPYENQTFALVNTANQMRILAQGGRDYYDGFLTIDYGPIYQDQLWRFLPREDGSYGLINVRSGRRLVARAGLEGGMGFMAVVAVGPVLNEQAWWLINQDQDEASMLCQKIRAEFACRVELPSQPDGVAHPPAAQQDLLREVSAPLSKNLDAAKNNNTRLQRQLLSMSSRLEWITDAHRRLQYTCGTRALDGGRAIPAAGFIYFSLVVALLLLVCPCLFCVRNRQKRTSQRSRFTVALCQSVDTQTILAVDVPYHVSKADFAGVPCRIVKIQCPGVQHADVEVNLIFNGCEITINRQASLGVEALVWRKTFQFHYDEGLFEFKEDQMQLENGFLQLVFLAYAFHNRAVRFPQHFSLASTDSDMCWEYTAECDKSKGFALDSESSTSEHAKNIREHCISLGSMSTASTS